MRSSEDAAASAPRRGRRRNGQGDARRQILDAAHREFLANGYDGSSLRGIARRAGVDAALVHHYFEGKADLFATAMGTPVRPDRIVAEVLAGPREHAGETLVRTILAALDADVGSRHAVGLVRTALGHDFAATLLRQFLLREVLRRVADGLDVDDGELRATLVASQVVGLIVVRYGIRAEPLASASHDDLARRIGPVIQWYFTGSPLDSLATLDSADDASE